MKTNNSNAFRELMEIRGLEMPTENELFIEGSDPIFPSPFKFGETTASALAARAIAANDLWELRTGRRQQIRLNVEAAAGTCLGGTAQTKKKNAEGVYKGIAASDALVHMVSITQPWNGSCHTSTCRISRKKYSISSAVKVRLKQSVKLYPIGTARILTKPSMKRAQQAVLS